MKEISLYGLEEIGRGTMSTIYKIDEDRVVKIYGADTTLEEIEYNKKLSDELVAGGVPVVNSYEIVRAGDRYGIVMELLGPDTVAKAVRKDPASEEAYGRKMAELLKKMHRTELPTGDLPDFRSRLSGWIGIMLRDHHMTERTARSMRQLVDALPDTERVIHLDLHEGNIMLRGDELVLIDIDEMCTGHPVFDIATLYINHDLAAGTPGLLEQAVGLDARTSRRMRKHIMRSYYSTLDAGSYKRAVSVAHMICMLLVGLAPARLGEISQLNKLNMWFIKNVAQPLFCIMWLKYRSNADAIFADVSPDDVR